MTAQTTHAPSIPDHCYPRMYAQVREQVAHHQLTVLRDEGLYRHLRFAAPGTMNWSFDLVTWPGHLAIAGDVGAGYMFARNPDMLTFFADGRPPGHINAPYWAQKLVGHPQVREFSERLFHEYLVDLVAQARDELEGDDDAAAAFVALVDEELSGLSNAHEAHQALEDFNRAYGGDFADLNWESHDVESWLDFTADFTRALHLILWGGQQYNQYVADRA